MKLDPVALELLTALAQYSTYDEVLVANKLFCLQGPWVSVETKERLAWYTTVNQHMITDVHISGRMISPYFIGQKHLSDLPAFLAKVRP